jgi:diaminohydroxyphosphoribosylaminopyrimidine deaminase/5-amino-6-(5-phosphoribosylamino)uracil reductase
MIGSGTALADDPTLTCRLPGLNDRSPVRVVLSRRCRLPLSSRLVVTARDLPTWLVTSADARPSTVAHLEEAGVDVIQLELGSDQPPPDLAKVLAALAERGITRLMVEGGAGLAGSLLKAGLVDRLAWFQAPMVIGGDGKSAIGPLSFDRLAELPAFERIASEVLASDLGTTYITREP